MMAKKKNEVRKSPFLYRVGQQVTYTKSPFITSRGETIDGVIKDRWQLVIDCGGGLTVVVNRYSVYSEQMIGTHLSPCTTFFTEAELKRRVVVTTASERKVA